MNQETVQALFTLQPLRQLTADNTYLLDRDHSVADGALVYESQVFRTKVNYQFTRAISARVIVEYDSTLANPAETSLKRTKEVARRRCSHGFRIRARQFISAITMICRIWTARSAIVCRAEAAIRTIRRRRGQRIS